MVEVAVKDCVCVSSHNIMTLEEAQAAISQQPLFAPQNEALQDNEHFKAATPTTPKTCLSQHSDTGREREVAGEKGGSQLDLSKPHFLSRSPGPLQRGSIHPICSF